MTESGGDLIDFGYLDSIFEFDSGYDLCQVFETALFSPLLLSTLAEFEHHMQHPITSQAAL